MYDDLMVGGYVLQSEPAPLWPGLLGQLGPRCREEGRLVVRVGAHGGRVQQSLLPLLQSREAYELEVQSPVLAKSDCVRYIGSKQRIAAHILAVIGEPNRRGHFVDLFCGAGAVSRAAAAEGWAVKPNDNLRCASLLTKARLLAKNDVKFKAWGGYANCIHELNSISPREGFIFSEYTPSGLSPLR